MISPVPSDFPLLTSAQSQHPPHGCPYSSFPSFSIIQYLYICVEFILIKSRQEAMILLPFSPWISIYKFPNADSKLHHELAFCLWIMKCAFLGTVCFASGCIWSKQLRAQCQWSQGPGSSPALIQPSSALAWILPKASSLFLTFLPFLTQIEVQILPKPKSDQISPP